MNHHRLIWGPEMKGLGKLILRVMNRIKIPFEAKGGTATMLSAVATLLQDALLYAILAQEFQYIDEPKVAPSHGGGEYESVVLHNN